MHENYKVSFSKANSKNHELLSMDSIRHSILWSALKRILAGTYITKIQEPVKTEKRTGITKSERENSCDPRIDLLSLRDHVTKTSGCSLTD